MRNPCKECDYYHEENNICQSKKCCTGGDGYVNLWDRLWCKPYKEKKSSEKENENPVNCKSSKNDIYSQVKKERMEYEKIKRT